MIVVTTPTGQIGSQLLERLLGADQAVRVIVRDRSKLDLPRSTGVEVVEGSHHDPEVVDRAFYGADAVFWLVPPNPATPDAHAHYRDFTRPACEAIDRHGVQRVVVVSSLGREHPRDAGVLTSAFEMEALLERTAAHLRVLRMPYYMENLLNQADALKHGTVVLPNDPDRTLALCATSDIAAVAAELLRNAAWTGREGVPVIGPNDLSPRGIAAVLSEVLGRPLELTPVPIDEFKATLGDYGMSDGWIQALGAMVVAQDAGIYDSETASASRSPTSLSTWAETVLEPALA